MRSNYYIGLMSGTSMDAVDAALVDISTQKIKLIEHHEEPIPEHLLNQLHQLCLPSNNEINTMGRIDREVGLLFAQATQTLLQKTNINAFQVTAIGSHGQTIRHMPNSNMPFSLQIGNPNVIASETNIDVIADFRNKDMALGGKGAPLVPAFHQAFFAKANKVRFVLNIGGIANITFLNGLNDVLGYDTGPGSTLMDVWYRKINGDAYDKDGQFAVQGTVSSELLTHLLSHHYFKQSPPKSTGRELFNDLWLETQLTQFAQLSNEDIQATLLEFSIQSIADAIKQHAKSGEVFICGGGACHPIMMKRLKETLGNFHVSTTEELDLHPMWVEAVAFAWLARQFKEKKPSNLPQVTGASREAILGAFYPWE